MAGFVTSSNLAQQIVTLFASVALEPLANTLVLGSKVNRFYENSPGEIGQYVNVPLPPTTFAAHSLGEGGPVSQQNPSITTVQVPINQHYETTFAVPDVTKTLTNLDLAATYIKPAMISVAEKVEADIIALAASFNANTPVGAANTPITATVVTDARKALVKAKVPSALPKYMAVSPETYGTMLGLAQFVNQYQIGSDVEALKSGDLSKIYGFDVIEHTLIGAVGYTPTTTNFAFAPDAIALVTRRLPPITPGLGAVSADIQFGNFVMRLVYSYAAANLAEQFTVSCLYGTTVLRNGFGVVVTT